MRASPTRNQEPAMDIDVFSPRELPVVFRVLRTALSPEGYLKPEEKAFLATYGRITGFPVPHDPKPITAAEVEIEGIHQRKRLIQLSALAALLDRPVKDGSLAFLKDLSKHLGTHDSVIDVIEAMKQGKKLRVRMLAMRRAFRVM